MEDGFILSIDFGILSLRAIIEWINFGLMEALKNFEAKSGKNKFFLKT